MNYARIQARAKAARQAKETRERRARAAAPALRAAALMPYAPRELVNVGAAIRKARAESLANPGALIGVTEDFLTGELLTSNYADITEFNISFQFGGPLAMARDGVVLFQRKTE